MPLLATGLVIPRSLKVQTQDKRRVQLCVPIQMGFQPDVRADNLRLVKFMIFQD